MLLHWNDTILFSMLPAGGSQKAPSSLKMLRSGGSRKVYPVEMAPSSSCPRVAHTMSQGLLSWNGPSSSFLYSTLKRAMLEWHLPRLKMFLGGSDASQQVCYLAPPLNVTTRWLTNGPYLL